MEKPPFGFRSDENIFGGLCTKYILASIMYYQHDFSPMDDSQFDNACVTLRMKYRETPQWFQDRVTYADLTAGTGYTIQPTEQENEMVQKFLSGEWDTRGYF